MNRLKRITFDPAVMGGEPCIRGMRVTVGMIVGLLAAGGTEQEILKVYPYLEAEDLREALAAVPGSGSQFPSKVRSRAHVWRASS